MYIEKHKNGKDSKLSDAEGGSAIREIAKQVARNPRIISLAGGLPSADIFPIDEIRRSFDIGLQQQGRLALQYAGTDGYLPLRRRLAERLTRKGMSVDPENILITSGSQQGIDLAGRILLERNDAVYVDGHVPVIQGRGY